MSEDEHIEPLYEPPMHVQLYKNRKNELIGARAYGRSDDIFRLILKLAQIERAYPGLKFDRDGLLPSEVQAIKAYRRLRRQIIRRTPQNLYLDRRDELIVARGAGVSDDVARLIVNLAEIERTHPQEKFDRRGLTDAEVQSI